LKGGNQTLSCPISWNWSLQMWKSVSYLGTWEIEHLTGNSSISNRVYSLQALAYGHCCRY
jgi:hypothetical protein